MDLSVLKRKLSTYRTEGGYLKNVGDELLMEILEAWEQWSGPAKGFYTAIGGDYRKMASLLGRAKKLKREGVFPESSFKEIKVDGDENNPTDFGSCKLPIILNWDQGKTIGFSQVDQLAEFFRIVGGLNNR